MSKLIQIVNENDEVIGAKARSEIDHSVDIYRSTALWLENSRGDVLVAQRQLTKEQHPGKWGPAVAGTVDEGETYESNMVKEAAEEIGLGGVEFTPVTKIFKDGQQNSYRQFTQVFRATVDQPAEAFTVQQEEVEQVKWISRSALAEDVRRNPQQYVPSMARLLALFEK